MPGLEYLTKTEKDVLKELKNKIIEQFNGRTVLIKLFGSKARGDAHQESDIDLLVVLKQKKRVDDDWIIDLELELMERYDYQFYLNTLVYDEQEFDRLNYLQTNFMLNVAEDGVNLWRLHAV
ncbi:MAG: nucleotidyltransferase domain-containing protein [bacterium]|nr:nucleotidyltransferase domain-containing protein [bacterium]